MPLQPIATSTAAAAENVARQIVNQITGVAQNVARTRKDGVPTVIAVPAHVLPNGMAVPAREGVPAVSADDINAALGEKNIALLDALGAALG